jgi:hypothetical protein
MAGGPWSWAFPFPRRGGCVNATSSFVLRQAQDEEAQDEVARLLIFLILSLSKDEEDRADSGLCKDPAS